MCVAHMHILCRLVLDGFEGHVIRTSGIKSVFSLGAMGLSSALGLNHKFLLNLGRFFFSPQKFQYFQGHYHTMLGLGLSTSLCKSCVFS